MNVEQLKGYWKQAKGEIQTQWGKLTDDDYDIINGESEKLVGKLMERYGIAKEIAEQQVNDFTAKINKGA